MKNNGKTKGEEFDIARKKNKAINAALRSRGSRSIVTVDRPKDDKAGDFFNAWIRSEVTGEGSPIEEPKNVTKVSDKLRETVLAMGDGNLKELASDRGSVGSIQRQVYTIAAKELKRRKRRKRDE